MEEIKEFFGKTWNQTEVDEHVVDRIKYAKSVIDIGCGFNPYKKFNHNLTGVDLVNEECDILDFDSMGLKYDVAICYGILHFNSYDWIRERLEWAVNHIKEDGEILIKVNPSKKEDQAVELRSSDVVWFERWNHGLAQHFAEIYNLEVWNWREWRNPLDNSVRYKFDYRRIGHGLK